MVELDLEVDQDKQSLSLKKQVQERRSSVMRLFDDDFSVIDTIAKKGKEFRK